MWSSVARAVEAWGPDWLAHAEVKLIAGGALATAATSPAAGTGSAAADSAVRGSTASAGRETVAPGEPEQAAPRANETLGPQGAPVEEPPAAPPGEAPDAQPAATPPAATPPEPNPALADAASSNVRPTRAPAARSGPDLSRMAPADMVPVSSLLRPPRAPWASLALAVVLGLVTVVFAFAGVGGDGSGADEPGTATVLVAGAELTDSGLQGVDLSEPVEFAIASPPAGAATMQVRFYAGGVPIGSSNEVPVVAGEGSLSATVSASSSRILSSGPVDAELLLRDASGAELPSPTVEIDPQRPFWSSVSGWLAIVLTVFVLGYAISLAAPLRRGRRRVRSTAAMVVVGAVGGATAVLWAWCLGGSQPSVARLVLAAAAGAGCAGAAASAVFLLGRRRRVRRRIRARQRARADVAR